jgi:hypothetical protein
MLGSTSSPRSPAAGPAAKWLVVVLLAVIAACLLVEVGISVSTAQSAVGPAATAAGMKNTFVVGGQITKDTYGLYLVDLEYGTICVYEWVPQTRKLRLMAARTYLFDRQLDEYNTELSPKEIKKLVAQQQRLDEAPPKP